MGSTNFTPNYNLPQFIGTDKPAWLTDINGAFSSIDTAIKNAADAASNASSVAGSASSAATAAANTANTLDTQINTPSTGLAAVVSDHTTDISNIKSSIGTTPLTTVAQTLTGAIEEVKGSVPVVTGALKLVSSGQVTATYDGTKTLAQAAVEIYTALTAVFSGLTASQKIRLTGGNINSPSNNDGLLTDIGMLTAIPTSIYLFQFGLSTGEFTLSRAKFASSANVYNIYNSFTVNDKSSDTPASGTAFLKYEIYDVL